ncbi:MAG: DUF4446 family protein [Patescibacteria group bacterium]
MQNYILISAVFLWLLVLSYLLFKLRKHYFNLISRTGKNKIDDILDSLLNDKKRIDLELEEVKKNLHENIGRSNLFIRKVGVIRYNPFGRVGNDQSFVLSLLDSENNGLLVNFIYTSDGLRVYTKKVVNGKGNEYQLSEEEEKAIKESA